MPEDCVLFTAAPIGGDTLPEIMVPSLMKCMRELNGVDCITQAFVATQSEMQRAIERKRRGFQQTAVTQCRLTSKYCITLPLQRPFSDIRHPDTESSEEDDDLMR